MWPLDIPDLSAFLCPSFLHPGMSNPVCFAVGTTFCFRRKCIIKANLACRGRVMTVVYMFSRIYRSVKWIRISNQHSFLPMHLIFWKLVFVGHNVHQEEKRLSFFRVYFSWLMSCFVGIRLLRNISFSNVLKHTHSNIGVKHAEQSDWRQGESLWDTYSSPLERATCFACVCIAVFIMWLFLVPSF